MGVPVMQEMGVPVGAGVVWSGVGTLVVARLGNYSEKAMVILVEVGTHASPPLRV